MFYYTEKLPGQKRGLKKKVAASRMAYILEKTQDGSMYSLFVPIGTRCGKRNCVNPEHLTPGLYRAREQTSGRLV